MLSSQAAISLSSTCDMAQLKLSPMSPNTCNPCLRSIHPPYKGGGFYLGLSFQEIENVIVEVVWIAFPKRREYVGIRRG